MVFCFKDWDSGNNMEEPELKRVVAYHTSVRHGDDVIEVDLDNYYTEEETIAKLLDLTGRDSLVEVIHFLKDQKDQKSASLGVLETRLKKAY